MAINFPTPIFDTTFLGKNEKEVDKGEVTCGRSVWHIFIAGV